MAANILIPKTQEHKASSLKLCQTAAAKMAGTLGHEYLEHGVVNSFTNDGRVATRGVCPRYRLLFDDQDASTGASNEMVGGCRTGQARPDDQNVCVSSHDGLLRTSTPGPPGYSTCS